MRFTVNNYSFAVKSTRFSSVNNFFVSFCTNHRKELDFFRTFAK